MRTAVVCIQSKNKKRYKQLRVNETQVSQNEASVKKLKTNNSDQTSSPSNKPNYYTRDIIRSLCDTIKSSAKRLFSIKFFDKNEENRENKENEMPSNVTGYKLGSIGPFCHLEQISKPDFSMLNMVPLDKNKLCIKDPEYVETVSSRMTLASLKRYMEGRKRLLRRSKTAVLPTHAICSTSDITKFVCLIEKDPMISLFLKRDICRLYADKYLLAMVLIYFARAHLTCYEFSRENFFAALYLAHDMEEDHEEIKYEVFPYCLGTKWKTYYTYLLSIRDDLFWAIDCRAVVSKKCCEQVMSLLPNHWIWERERPEYHAVLNFVNRHSENKDEFCQPRGPFKSPYWCKACLERECMDSENSYIIYSSLSESSYTSDSTSSVPEYEKPNNGVKDSGFESFLFPNDGKDVKDYSDEEEEDLDTSLQSTEILPASPLDKT